MLTVSELRDLINTMLQVLATLGGISIALLLFSFSRFTDRVTNFLRTEPGTPAQTYGQLWVLMSHRDAFRATTLSVLTFTWLPACITATYYLTRQDPKVVVLLLTACWLLGVFL